MSLDATRAAYVTVRDPELVRDVFRRPTDFPPHNALLAVTPLRPEALRILIEVGFALPPVLASATGAKHRITRKVVAKFFTPAKVAAVAPRVAELTRQRAAVVADHLDAGPTDLAPLIGHHVPATVMAELIGSELPALGTLNRWSRDSLELFWGWPEPAHQLELARSAAGLYAWLSDEVAASQGGDSLFGALHHAGLPPTEICALGYFLLIAGQQTTAQLIDIACYRALQQPDAWRELGTDGGGAARGFVRRVLATESSVPTWRRVATHATRLGDTDLPAGAEILLELTGHHPPEAGPTAYSLAFGHGLHRCLGARLAELEAALVLEHTARALPDLRLDGAEPGWLRLLSFQSPTTVTVVRP